MKQLPSIDSIPNLRRIVSTNMGTIRTTPTPTPTATHIYIHPHLLLRIRYSPFPRSTGCCVTSCALESDLSKLECVSGIVYRLIVFFFCHFYIAGMQNLRQLYIFLGLLWEKSISIAFAFSRFVVIRLCTDLYLWSSYFLFANDR